MYVCGRFSSCLPAKQCCQPLSVGLSSGQTLSAGMQLGKEKLSYEDEAGNESDQGNEDDEGDEGTKELSGLQTKKAMNAIREIENEKAMKRMKGLSTLVRRSLLFDREPLDPFIAECLQRYLPKPVRQLFPALGLYRQPL